jgi:protein-tyrosine phosphatase
VHNYEIHDSSDVSLSKLFVDIPDIIDEAIESGARVLVHCQKGISRSSTVVLAYLMAKKKMSFREAHLHVFKQRFLSPIVGI